MGGSKIQRRGRGTAAFPGGRRGLRKGGRDRLALAVRAVSEALEGRTLLSSTTLSPTDDAFVRDGTYATTNFASSTTLEVKYDASSYDRESYLKFNTASLPAVVSAHLRLYGHENSVAAITVKGESATGTWSESTVTWNTKPTISGTALDTESVNSTTDAWYDWDVTSYARTQQQAGASSSTLGLQASSATSPFASFYSKEYATTADRPQLVVTTLLAPSGLTATAASSSQINLSWADNSDNESGFKVERSTDGTTWTSVATTAANATSYSDTGLTASTTYQYRVKATVTSTVDTAPTSAASATTSSAGTTVTTALAASADSYVRDGTYASTNFGSDATVATKKAAANSGFNRNIFLTYATSSVTGTLDSAKVRLYGNNNGGSDTNVVVNIYAVTSPSWTESGLTWNNQPTAGTTVLTTATVTDNTSRYYEWDVTSYVNAERAAGRNTVGFMVQVSAATSTSVPTFNSKEAVSNQPSLTVTQPAVSTPAAPSGLTAVAASETQINLAWADNSTNETGFKIEQSTDGTTFTQIATVGANVTTYNNTGLSHPVTYTYRIRATNTAGDSSYTSTASDYADAAPTIATAAAASPATVTGATTTLSVLGADDGGEAGLTYQWEVTGTPPGLVAFSSANGTNSGKSVTVTFEKAGTYGFLVTAYDGYHYATSTVSVTVGQTVTTIKLDQPGAAVADGQTHTFVATAYDQFGDPLATQPTFTWSVDSGGVGGTVAGTGVYTAPSSGTGSDTVRASAGGVSATGLVQAGQIVGTVYGDADANSAQGGSEGGLSGWTVYLDANGNGSPDSGEPSTTTDANGNYALTGSCGYSCGTLRAVQQTGWSLTQGSAGYALSLSPGQTATEPFGASGGPTVSVTATDDTATEGGIDTGTFTFHRTSSTGSLQVRFTPAGTARDGVDYSLSGATADTATPGAYLITFGAGESDHAVTLTAAADGFFDSDESANVTVANDGAYLGAGNTAAVAVLAEDAVTSGDVQITVSVNQGKANVTARFTENAHNMKVKSVSLNKANAIGQITIVDNLPNPLLKFTDVTYQYNGPAIPAGQSRTYEVVIAAQDDASITTTIKVKVTP